MIRRVLLGTISLCLLVACSGDTIPEQVPEVLTEAKLEPIKEFDCVGRVYALDAELATTRDHACEEAPLADAVQGYVRGLAHLDFHDCPDGFEAAFAVHAEAWERAIPFLQEYSAMRGEMHELFEQIRASSPKAAAHLEATEAPIWSTWAEVEAVDGRH